MGNVCCKKFCSCCCCCCCGCCKKLCGCDDTKADQGDELTVRNVDGQENSAADIEDVKVTDTSKNLANAHIRSVHAAFVHIFLDFFRLF